MVARPRVVKATGVPVASHRTFPDIRREPGESNQPEPCSIARTFRGPCATTADAHIKLLAVSKGNSVGPKVRLQLAVSATETRSLKRQGV